MEIHYCDLCNIPLKGRDYWNLVIGYENDKEKVNINNYNDYADAIEKAAKEICPKCKDIIVEIFKLRLENLNKLSQELLGIYGLPTKKKDDKKGCNE